MGPDIMSVYLNQTGPTGSAIIMTGKKTFNSNSKNFKCFVTNYIIKTATEQI